MNTDQQVALIKKQREAMQVWSVFVTSWNITKTWKKTNIETVSRQFKWWLRFLSFITAHVHTRFGMEKYWTESVNKN